MSAPLFEASVATFRGDQLDSCFDYAVAPNPFQEVAATELLKAFGATTGDATSREQRLVLAKRCAAQFPDGARATCTVAKQLEIGQMTVKAHLYQLTVSRMRECLSEGGDWQLSAETVAAGERIQGHLKRIEELAARGAARQ